MKLVRGSPDAFRIEMDVSEASEDELKRRIDTIAILAAGIFRHGYTNEVRERDRGGNSRYAEVERALDHLQLSTRLALMQIKFLDFPEVAYRPEGETLR